MSKESEFCPTKGAPKGSRTMLKIDAKQAVQDVFDVSNQSWISFGLATSDRAVNILVEAFNANVRNTEVEGLRVRQGV